MTAGRRTSAADAAASELRAPRKLDYASPQRPALDYARPRRAGSGGGRWAVCFGGAGVGLVAVIVVLTAATAGARDPRADIVAGACFIGLPLCAAAALVSGTRGLLPEARYRGRAVLGLKLTAAAVAAAFAVIGWMAAMKQ